MIGRLDLDEDGQPETDLAGVHEGDPPGDDPRLLELLDAFPAGRLGKADAFGELRDGERRVALQLEDDLPVDAVHTVGKSFSHLQGHGHGALPPA
jgi:hypothetical protein